MATLSPSQLNHLHALLAEPSIDSQLPRKFAAGSELTEMKACCSQCRRPLQGNALRGRLRAFNDQMLILDAVSYCEPCDKIQGVAYRIRDDLSFEGMTPDGWRRWEARPATPVGCVKRLFRGPLGWFR